MHATYRLRALRSALVAGLALVTAQPALAAGPRGSGFEGAIKCWVNKDGVRECGTMVPPEYVDQGYQEISESGISVREVERAKTPEEMEAERRAEEEAKAQEALREERVKEDRVLLQTFTTERDLTMTRDSKLAVIDSRIRLTQNRLDRMQENLRALQEQAARDERSGKEVSDSVREHIAQVQRQIQENQEYIDEQRKEQEGLRDKYRRDLERFRALKTGTVRPGDPPGQ